MCLISTDLPVPDGPRTIEIMLSGMPRLQPFRIRVRPNCLTRSMISIASSPPWSRLLAGVPLVRLRVVGVDAGDDVVAPGEVLLAVSLRGERIALLDGLDVGGASLVGDLGVAVRPRVSSSICWARLGAGHSSVQPTAHSSLRVFLTEL